MAERLELLGTIDGQRVAHAEISNRSLGYMRPRAAPFGSISRQRAAASGFAVEDDERPAVARPDPAGRDRVALRALERARDRLRLLSRP